MVRAIGLLGVAVMTLIIFNVPKSMGILGVGDSVYDIANHVENIAQVANQVAQLERQLEHLFLVYQNLENNFSIRNLGLSWNRLVPTINFYGRALGVPYRARFIPIYYGSVYGLPGLRLPAAGLINQHYNNIFTHSRIAAEEAMVAQADHDTSEEELLIITELQHRNDESIGAHQVAQTSNEIALAQMEQRNRQMMIQSASARVDAVRMAEAEAIRNLQLATMEHWVAGFEEIEEPSPAASTLPGR
jgi:conjugal transfer/entry exclusion protein